jgi:hypothetical protein
MTFVLQIFVQRLFLVWGLTSINRLGFDRSIWTFQWRLFMCLEVRGKIFKTLAQCKSPVRTIRRAPHGTTYQFARSYYLGVSFWLHKLRIWNGIHTKKIAIKLQNHETPNKSFNIAILLSFTRFIQQTVVSVYAKRIHLFYGDFASSTNSLHL